MLACPDDNRLEELLEETLQAAERDMVSAHVASCSSCQLALERLTQPPVSLRGFQSATGRATSGLSAQLIARLEQRPPSASSQTTSSDQPKVAGYEVLEELGRGGMGVVYRAVHERLNRTVALKMILAGAHAGPREIARFRHEAEAVAQLHHPNIVQIFDVGEAGGHPYCALELVEGGSLVQHLRGAPLPFEATARFLEVLARTVHFAHERGIVHRDLKPANILLAWSGPPPLVPSEMGLRECIPKITDFGLAKRLDEQTNATLSGELVGTPSYMAPEQAAGRPRRVGPLVDVYALGAILYEMLTGHPPFKGATALDTVLQVLHEEPVRPSRLRPDVPRDLETICLKCLEKSSTRRYASALDLAEDVRRFRKGDPVIARPVGPRERFWKWVRQRPTASALVASLVLIAMTAFAAVTWQWRETARARDDALQANNRARAALYRSIIAQSQLRWRLNDFAGASAGLRRFHLAPDQQDPRGWEWAYLASLYASDLMTMTHNEGGSSGGLALSPNGRQVASVLVGQREVRVWSTVDGTLAYALLATPGAHRVAFRPDGKVLAVADNTGGVTVWDLATRRSKDFMPHTRTIVGLTFSPDGKWLATASGDRTVTVWNAETGSPRHGPLVHADRVHTVAFSPNGAWLATGEQEGHVLLWEAEKGTLLETLTGHKSAVYGVAFSPTGKRLTSAGSNGNVRIWDLVSWQEHQRSPARQPAGPGPKPRVVQSLTGNGGAALGITYSPDGRYVAYGCSDGTARVWYLNSGVLRVIFRGHTAPVEVVRFSPDGRRLYSCCPEQGAVKVWDLTRPPEYATLARTRHPEYPGKEKAGTLPEVKVWDLLLARPGPTQASTGPDVEALAFQDEGKRLVSVTVGGRLQTWDTASGMLLDERPIPLTADLVSPAVLADFSSDGLRLAGRRSEPGDGGLVVGIWDVATTRPIAVLKGHRYPVFGVRFSIDGHRLATFACDRSASNRPHEINVWDANSGQLLNSRQGSGALYSIAFSPDGRWLATGKEDGTVEVVDWARGKKGSVRHDHKGAVTALAFSRDGRWLASAAVGDQAVRIVDTGTWGRREQTLAIAPGLLCDLAFTHDGKRLSGISRDVVKLWDVRTGEELLTLQGAPQRHRDPAFNARLAFSPDGRRLAGSNWDESISVWEAESPGPELQEARRGAADQRAPLWHLQEAEQCLLTKTIHPFAALFHLHHLGDAPLAAPLRERKDHVQRWAATR